jgi:MFS family permease
MSDQNSILSVRDRYVVLTTAFLGWFFAGMMMSTSALAMRSAAIDLLARAGRLDLAQYQAFNQAVQKMKQDPVSARPVSSAERAEHEMQEGVIKGWYAYLQCAWLLGAAAGGLVLGRLGDRLGRASGMACSILCYSILAGVATLAQTPGQLLVLWFIACLGVGGMWPNGVALVSETWSNLSRPLVAGIMGMAANVGLFAMSTLGTQFEITPGNWHWTLFVCAAPAVLGAFALLFVPESPRWKALRDVARDDDTATEPPPGVFRPPLLTVTLLGIVLASVPLIGGWGSASWMIPWAEKVGEQSNPPDPYLKAQVGTARALTGMFGSLLGGWVAHVFGRRLSFCLISLAALFCAQWTFWFLVPTDLTFLIWVSALGFFSGIYFGWLPLFLPELFPTRVRSTGSGVSFNFGRILTALTIFATGAITSYFGGDYARIGRITSLIFLIGALAIWLAPDTTRRQLET